MSENNSANKNEEIKKKHFLKRMLCSWKFWLVIVLLLSITVVVAQRFWEKAVNHLATGIFEDHSRFRVAPIRFGKVKVNPFTQELVIEELYVPQVKVEGVADSLLIGHPVFKCERLQARIDFNAWQEKQLVKIKSLAVEGMELGAVMGPEITRVSLSVFPGLLMGEIPNPEGTVLTRYDYELDKLIMKGELRCIPSAALKAKNISEVVIENFVIDAREMTNLEHPNSVAPATLKVTGDLAGGALNAKLTAKTMFQFDRQGSGKAQLKIENVNLKKVQLFVSEVATGLSFERGAAHMDWDVGINKSYLEPHKTEFKMDNIFAKASKEASGDLMMMLWGLNTKAFYKKELPLKGRITQFSIGKHQFKF